MGFSVFPLVLLACAGSEMHPSSGDRGEKTNEHQQRLCGVFSQKNVKKGRKLIFFFLWQPRLNCRMFKSEVCLCYTHME